MGAKYFVWGEGVWREVDLTEGRVVGWRRRARFVFVRRGRLLLARRRRVLRALQALAAGLPSVAADGPRLSYRSKSKNRSKHHQEPRAPPALPPACEHYHCCSHNGYSIQNAWHPPAPAQPPPPLTSPLTRPSPPMRDAATCTEPERPQYSSAEEFVYQISKPPVSRSAANDVSALVVKHTRAKPSTPASSTDDEPLRPAPVCKELVVSEADIAALRGFVARTRPSALARFDADDAYKRALFYAINPLVELQRCAQLERLLESRAQSALPHFAARLGLTPCVRQPEPRRRRRPTSSTDTDKENKNEQSSQNRVVSDPPRVTRKHVRLQTSHRTNKSEDVVVETRPTKTNGLVSEAKGAKHPVRSTPPAEPETEKRLHVISQRASQGNGKEYSNLEDHAIVAWVSVGSRACQVGGNRVWRDLETQYTRLTGRARSWHSLRNRYLRYILPSLGALQLPPSQVSRLRAAAATGAQKRRAAGVGAKRHSMFKEPERGAASRNPRTALSALPAHTADATNSDNDGPSSPKRRSLRARVSVEASGGGVARRSPRYSDVTRQFAARHRSDTSSPLPSPTLPAPVTSPPPARSRRLQP